MTDLKQSFGPSANLTSEEFIFEALAAKKRYLPTIQTMYFTHGNAKPLGESQFAVTASVGQSATDKSGVMKAAGTSGLLSLVMNGEISPLDARRVDLMTVTRMNSLRQIVTEEFTRKDFLPRLQESVMKVDPVARKKFDLDYIAS
jgi:hypothetical protein